MNAGSGGGGGGMAAWLASDKAKNSIYQQLKQTASVRP